MKVDFACIHTSSQYGLRKHRHKVEVKHAAILCPHSTLQTDFIAISDSGIQISRCLKLDHPPDMETACTMLQYKSLQPAERFLSLQRNHFATLPPSE